MTGKYKNKLKYQSRFKILCLLLIGVLILSSCSKNVESNPVENSTAESTDVVVIDEQQNQNADNSSNKQEVSNVSEQNTKKAPLTGLPLKDNMPIPRPVVVMLDNHYGARPQSGISKADHVYEILAEGRITRYMAVFHSDIPEKVGPIRSARPYFIDKALEYKPYYVHVGGSMQALTDIINLKMGDIDGLSSGGKVFWRESHKKIPHNMYSNIEVIQGEGNRRGHIKEVEIESWNFKNDKYIDNKENKESKVKKNDKGHSPYYIDEESEFVKTDDMKINNIFSSTTDKLLPAKGLMIFYKNKSERDKLGYFITYQYNFDKGVYDRFVNGMRQFDEIDQRANTKDEDISDKGIFAKNIIVQIANHKVIDKEGRRKVDLVGSGTGYYLVDGMVGEITWEKKSRKARTIYKYKNGKEVEFEAGNIWFQIIENADKTYIINR